MRHGRARRSSPASLAIARVLCAMRTNVLAIRSCVPFALGAKYRRCPRRWECLNRSAMPLGALNRALDSCWEMHTSRFVCMHSFLFWQLHTGIAMQCLDPLCSCAVVSRFEPCPMPCRETSFTRTAPWGQSARLGCMARNIMIVGVKPLSQIVVMGEHHSVSKLPPVTSLVVVSTNWCTPLPPAAPRACV